MGKIQNFKINQGLNVERSIFRELQLIKILNTNLSKLHLHRKANISISIALIPSFCLPWSNYSSTSSTHIASIFSRAFLHFHSPFAVRLLIFCLAYAIDLFFFS